MRSGRHPSYAQRNAVPAMQLQATLSSFHGNSATSTVHSNGESLRPKSATYGVDRRGYQLAQQRQQLHGSGAMALYGAPETNIPETGTELDGTPLDPNFQTHRPPPRVSPQQEAILRPSTAGNNRSAVSGSAFAKALLGTRNDEDVYSQDLHHIPGKRPVRPMTTNEPSALIGGIQCQDDPFQTTTQQMGSPNRHTEKKVSRKGFSQTAKTLRNASMVSPITNQPLADYGDWRADQAANNGIVPPPCIAGEANLLKKEQEVSDPLLAKVRDAMRKRGAKGMLGLKRLFRILDDDESGCLSLSEFTKGMQEYRLQLTEQEILHLFKRFDRTKAGKVLYNDFLITVNGGLNAKRRGLVHEAFRKIDTDGSGIASFSEICALYDTRHHPDVVSGQRTSEDVMREFIANFEVGGTKDGNVTLEEFEEYYSALSASIDRDDYFELMIRNAWHLSGGEGAAANTSNKRVLVTLADGTEVVREVQNDLGVRQGDTAEYQKRLAIQGGPQGALSLHGSAGDKEMTAARGRPPPALGSSIPSMNGAQPYPPRPASASATGRPRTANVPSARATQVNGRKRLGVDEAVNHPTVVSPGLSMIISRLRTALKNKGATGLLGLKRQFRLLDTDESGTLDFNEFKNILTTLGSDLSGSDMRNIFSFFDRDGNGSISSDEFLRGLREPMNEKRLELVKLAFSRLDVDGSGVVDAEEIKSMYDTSRHPDVIARRKTPSQVLREFLQTFEEVHTTDGLVTAEEFEEYYACLSASISNDEYFELMMRNAWHLSGGSTAAASNSSNLRVCVRRSSGEEVVVALQNDLGLKKDDIPAIYARLLSQGESDIVAIDGKVLRRVNINGVDVVTTTGVPTTSPEAQLQATGPAVRPAPSRFATTTRTADSHADARLAAVPRPVAGADRPRTGGRPAPVPRADHAKLANEITKSLSIQATTDASRRVSSVSNSSNGKVAAANIIGETLLGVLRQQILMRGLGGLVELQRRFSEADANGNGLLDLAEFTVALTYAEVPFSAEQFSALFEYVDRDHSGGVDYEELLHAIRGPFPTPLLTLVHQIFDQLSSGSTSSDVITPQMLVGMLDMSRHPSVMSGERSADQLMNELLETFDVGQTVAGCITREEFVRYYHNLNAVMQDEELFDLTLRRIWNQPEREDARRVSLGSAINGSGNTPRGRINSARDFAVSSGMQIPEKRPQSFNSTGVRRPSHNMSNAAPTISMEDQITRLRREAVNQLNEDNFDQAILLFEQAHSIAQSYYTPGHPELVKATKSLDLARSRASTSKSRRHH